jgi:uncharacterized membrane protein
MLSNLLQRWFRGPSDSPPRRRRFTRRLRLEPLETRELLDAGLPSALVGRTLSSYFVGGIQNNQETITFTVYNEQANPLSGVLLTDTLQTGVTFASASAQPDRSGQNLAWSLGTINGYDRASVSLVVSLTAPIPLQLDTGAHAYATLDAGAVSVSTPAATLRPGTVDPLLLASTPDANTTDPFIQAEAAALAYDPQNIFNFLHNNIGYNSYLGSVRGARGTLWSGAGNSLDVANLGVALMRGSGIPARYAQGTLSGFDTRNLILSMFPATYQTVGYIPAGTTTADPTQDPQLIAETQTHHWFQFDTGTGFQHADPLLTGFIGIAATTAQSTFNLVPDNLREKTEITLQAEIYSQAGVAFGLGLQTTTVLDATFNDVDLVGRPLTLGHFVASSAVGGLVFTTVTNTYSPYLRMGDDAFDAGQDQFLRATDYQEILTNFPLGSQFLSGLFLNITFSGPQGAAETVSKTLVDRIGYAGRHAGGTVQLSPVDPSALPVVTPLDLHTISIQPGGRDPASVAAPGVAGHAAADLQAFAAVFTAASPDDQVNLIQQASQVILTTLLAVERSEVARFEAQASYSSNVLARAMHIAAYPDRPRVTIASTQFVPANDGSGSGYTRLGFDILRSNYRVVLGPGQSLSTLIAYNVARGLAENNLEGGIVSRGVVGSPNQFTAPIYTGAILQAAAAQGIPVITLTPDNPSEVDLLSFSPDIKARISAALAAGKAVTVPSASVMIGGTAQVGWYEIDANTGQTVGILQDGSHGGIDYGNLLRNIFLFAYNGFSFLAGYYFGHHAFDIGAIGEALKDFSHLLPEGLGHGLKATLVAAGLYAAGKAFADLKAWAKKNPYFVAGFLAGLGVATYELLKDPPLTDIVFDRQSFTPTNATDAVGVAVTSSLTAGTTQASLNLQNVQAHGQLMAAWNSPAISAFQSTSLSASTATVLDSTGHTVGSGTVVFSATNPVPVSISGNDAYSVSGSGSLSFYGPAESNLGVSGTWDRYSATVTGTVSLTITTDSLTLNGMTLPAGTYTITTASLLLAGQGASSSPNFSGSASITTTAATVDLGRGTGTISVNGIALDPTNGVTLSGYTGSLGVSASGGLDAVTLTGTSANAVTVAGSPATLTTDQNAPVTFHANVRSSLADTWNISAAAPPGWTVSVDQNGNVTVTPALGLQTSTYPIQIVATSSTNPDLVAQALVNVTLTRTQPGITLNVVPDPLLTVPFNGAQLPTAFNALIHNNGPSAVTINLAFSNLPPGFILETSASSVTIPAGATGSVGLYFVPRTQVPPPGSMFTFTATASGFGVTTVMQNVTFTVPEVHNLTLAGNPENINAVPGAASTDQVTISNVGNVPENVTFSSTALPGLTVAGLTNMTLQPAQSVTENVTLTPAAATPLNSYLDATITATFGPSGSPQTQQLEVPVHVVVPGALEIAGAVSAAHTLGEDTLAARLTDLSAALTNLVVNPTSAVAKSQALASLDAVIGLLQGDVYLPALTTPMTTDRTALAQAGTVTEINQALTLLGSQLGMLKATLIDEIAHSVSVRLDPDQGEARPQIQVLYTLFIQNTGNQATTYDLSVSGLPANVTASFNHPSVTLQPGQVIFGGPNGVVLSLVETVGELIPTSFNVIATAEGATEINRSAPGSLTVRNAFVQVPIVTPNPPFTDPGGRVDVSSRILNVTDNPFPALAYFTVRNPAGTLVFTSTAVTVPFSGFVSYPTVDLGVWDTTGMALGSYTINVFVTDPMGNALTDTAGQGSVVVGSPVNASLSLSSTTALAYFPFQQSYTNTLQVQARTTFPPPLTLTGITGTDATETSLALNGTLAYVSGVQDISIVDIHDPAHPTVLSTFGQDQLTPGNYNVCRVAGNLLLIGTQNTLNTNYFNLVIYSIANPRSPTFISNTQFNYHFISDMYIRGTTAFFPTAGITTFVGVVLTDQFGDFVAVDFSNPAQPHLDNVLYNNRGAPDGGDFQEDGIAVVNSQYTYAASTTSVGADSQTGSGRVVIINTTDPTHLAVANTLLIPGTVDLLAIAIQGTHALVVGATGGSTITSGIASATIAGNLTLTPIDISDPLHPRIIGPTFVTQNTFLTRGDNMAVGKVDAIDLGNGLVAISDTQLNGHPQLLLVDASDPNHLIFGAVQTARPLNGLIVSGNLLYAAGQDGLLIYTIGQVVGVPVTVTARVPTNPDVTYSPNSFNIAPTQITHGSGFDTFTWITSLGAGASTLTLTWTSNLMANAPPGQAHTIALGGSVNFISQGTPGVLNLPGTTVDVQGYSFLFVSPGTQTIRPGATADYNIEIQRSVSTPTPFNISIVGLPTAWVNVPSMVTVQPFHYLDVPLVVLPPFGAPVGNYDFTVVVSGLGQTDSYQVRLVLAGQPVLPTIDPDAHGVVAALTPSSTSAGQGTTGRYMVRVTNTGSASDTFTLAATGLPAGIRAVFDQTSVAVPPGATNYRDVPLTLTSATGTAPGSDPFMVTATSTTHATVTGTASGTLVVLANGVHVTLSPLGGPPGSTFQMMVANTGQVQDTFDLTLSGPAGLVANLGVNQVTLAAGGSQTIPITTGAVNFALPGMLNLTATATSRGNPAVHDAAAASVNIPVTRGVTAQFHVATLTILRPGAVSFQLVVNNTGNVEDGYTAVITGTTGPITVSLIGPDGQPTQSIPEFHLPGLAAGGILLQGRVTAQGTGTVTVQVRSLSDGTIRATATAQVTATSAGYSTMTTLTTSANPAAFGQPVTFTALVTQAVDREIPTGQVTFLDGSTTLGTGTLDTQGRATYTTTALGLGNHSVTAVYGGGPGFLGSTSAVLTETILRGTTSVVSSALPNPVFGQPVTFTATVTPADGQSGIPSGSVIFLDGTTPLGTGTLNGQGQATYTSTALTAGSHTITAIYGGDSSFIGLNATALTQVVGQASTTTAVVSGLNPAVVGQFFTLTATVSASAPAAGTPTGRVTFFDGTTSLGSATLNASAQATLPVALASAGSHSLTAVYNGDSNLTSSPSAALPQTINQGATGTTVTSSGSPSVYGQAVTFTAVVSPVSPAAGVPTGQVAFLDDTTTLGTGTLAGAGQATFTTTALGLGDHSITAVYASDSNYTGSTSAALTQTINQAASATALQSSGSPSAVGQAVTFTATVTASSPASGVPTGMVNFQEGATVLGMGSLDATGTATFTIDSFPVGSHGITAVYAGDTNYTGSTTAVLNQVVSDSLTGTTTALTSSVSPSVYSQAVTFTAIVTPTADGPPTGSVTFLDGTTVLGSGTLDGSGQATLTTSSLALGSHNITAVYGGDGSFAGSTSGALTQVVGQAATTTAVTSSVNPAVYGQLITLTAQVSPVAPATAVPTGMVDFLDGTTVLGSVALDSSGQATFTTALALGDHSISVNYDADTNFTASGSAVLTETVNQAGSSSVVNSSSNPSAPGQLVTFTAIVTAAAPGAGIPTGTVHFLDGSTELGTGTLDSSGMATLTTTGLGVGTHSITVAYDGDTNFTNSTSPVLSQVVSANLTATTTTATSSSSTTVYGQSVTFTAVVIPTSGSGVPSGTVTFMDGTTVLGSGTLDSQGQAMYTTTVLGVGSHNITAVYGGDSNYTGSTSAVVAQTVNRATTTSSVASSNVSTVYGQSVTFTATVVANAPGAGTPTGQVTFLDGSTVLGTAMLDAQGHATFSTAALAASNHAITAVYGGDSHFAGLNVIALTQTVNRDATLAALVSSLNPSRVGQSVTFTATITAAAPGSGTPTGTVMFTEGTTVLGMGTLDAQGHATLTLTTLPAGSHAITASYQGDGNFDVSLSSVVTQIVNP